ncbi:MAG: hypothetical protein KGK07_12830 [Chloroflexota bacterium]|nr:hypothetical protein [Chloroflexota bacterium]
MLLLDAFEPDVSDAMPQPKPPPAPGPGDMQAIAAQPMGRYALDQFQAPPAPAPPADAGDYTGYSAFPDFSSVPDQAPPMTSQQLAQAGQQIGQPQLAAASTMYEGDYGTPHMNDLQAAASFANIPFQVTAGLVKPATAPVTAPVDQALPSWAQGPAETAGNLAAGAPAMFIPGVGQLGLAGMGLSAADVINQMRQGNISPGTGAKILGEQAAPMLIGEGLKVAAPHVAPALENFVPRTLARLTPERVAFADTKSEGPGLFEDAPQPPQEAAQPPAEPAAVPEAAPPATASPEAPTYQPTSHLPTLVGRSVAEQPAVDQALQQAIADVPGAHMDSVGGDSALGTDVKATNPEGGGLARIVEKADERGAAGVSDYLRSRIAVDTPADLVAVRDRLAQQFDVVQEDNKLESDPAQPGYHAYHMQLQAPDGGLSFEVQLVPTDVARVQEGPMRGFYDKWRDVPESERGAAFAKDAAPVAQQGDQAYQDWLAKDSTAPVPASGGAGGVPPAQPPAPPAGQPEPEKPGDWITNFEPSQAPGRATFSRPGPLADVGPGGQPVVQGIGEGRPSVPPGAGGADVAGQALNQLLRDRVAARGRADLTQGITPDLNGPRQAQPGDPVGDFLQRVQQRQEMDARMGTEQPQPGAPDVGGRDVGGNALDALNRRLANQAAAEQDVHRTGEMIADRATALGADSTVAAAVRKSFENTAQTVQSLSVRTANSFDRVVARIQGTFPGAFGVMAEGKVNLQAALDQVTGSWEKEWLPIIQNLLDKEGDGLTFHGPARLADEITANKNLRDYTIVTHPEQFSGMSVSLRTALAEAQRMQDAYRLAVVTNPKYADPVEGNYLPQIWDMGDRGAAQTLPRPKGAEGITKQRAWKDWQQAYGSPDWPYKLRDMPASEYIHAGLQGTNTAIADAVARAEILERWGTTKPSADVVPFNNALYRGWYADPETVNMVDQMYEPPAGVVREASTLAARMRNSAFLVDLKGVALRVAGAMQQGVPITEALLNRSLAALHLPHLDLYSDEMLPHTVEAQLAGGMQGVAGAGFEYDPNAGTLLRYVPGLRRLDPAIQSALKHTTMTLWQNTLTPLRNLIGEGNLIALKLGGQDITDAAVQRRAWRAADATTGASIGAAKAGRRTGEGILMTSPQNRRAMFSQLGVLANIANVRDHPAQIVAAQTLASMGVTLWGLGSAVNMKWGTGQPLSFNPADPKFLTMTLNGVNVPLMPDQALAKAMGKSITDLAQQNPEDAAKAWAAFGYGSQSPAVKPLTSALGFGYGPHGFSAGGLSGRERLINAAPVPVQASQYVQKPDDFSNPTVQVAQNLGFPAYAEAARDAQAQKAGYTDFNSAPPGVQRTIDQDPQVQQEALANLTPKEQALRGEQQTDDTKLAAGTLTPIQWRDNMHTREAQAAFDRAGQAQTTTGNDVLDGYYAIFRDPALVDQQTGNPVDQQALFDALDAYRAQHPDIAQMTGFGATKTGAQQQYADDLKAINASGYFGAADAAVRYWAQQHGANFQTYAQFMSALSAEAKKWNARPQDAQAYQDVQSLSTQGKDRFRTNNPHIDALLVAWGMANKPRTDVAASEVKQLTGLSVPVAAQ